MKLWEKHLIKSDEDKITGKDIAKGAGAGYVTKKSLDHGLHRVFGLRGETHTTNKEAAKQIKKAGYILDPTKGGTGASKTDPDYVKHSKGYSHITGYNKNTVKAIGSPTGLTQSRIQKLQPLSKYTQRIMYRSAVQPEFSLDDPGKTFKKAFVKSLIPGKSKTFHVVGSEDFYNKRFIPDVDDIALKTDKPLKVSKTRLGATLRGIRKSGFSGIKSAPKGRIAIGAGILAAGGYASKKLSEPLWKKLIINHFKKNGVDIDYARNLINKNQNQKLQKYLDTKGVKSKNLLVNILKK